MNIASTETWLHRVNPTLKLFGVLFLCFAVLWIHELNYLLNLTVGIFILFLLFSGHRFKHLVPLLIPFGLIFLSTSSAMILFGQGVTTWFKWGLVHITEESFYRGLLVGLRALLFAALGLTFALTTKPVHLFYSLMQQAKLKPKYAYSFMAAFRLIPIIMEEFQTIRNAMRVRGVERQKGIRAGNFKLKAYSIPLLSGSIRRAHRIAVAMEAKRFTDANGRTYYYQLRFSKADLTFTCYFVFILVAGYYVAGWLPIFII